MYSESHCSCLDCCSLYLVHTCLSWISVDCAWFLSLSSDFCIAPFFCVPSLPLVFCLILDHISSSFLRKGTWRLKIFETLQTKQYHICSLAGGKILSRILKSLLRSHHKLLIVRNYSMDSFFFNVTSSCLTPQEFVDCFLVHTLQWHALVWTFSYIVLGTHWTF